MIDEIRRLADEVDTTALCDVAEDVRVMSPALRCRSANPVLCGPAVTVRCRDDFFGVIQAIELARAGDVLVVDGGGRETALAGELFARVALGKGLAGIVVDGGYRDLRFVAGCRLPVYSRHVTPKAGTTAPAGSTSILSRPPAMSFTFLAKSVAYSWKMSLAGQVLWNRNEVGAAWAITIGALRLAPAATAAPLSRLRRRGVMDFVIVSVSCVNGQGSVRCRAIFGFLGGMR